MRERLLSAKTVIIMEIFMYGTSADKSPAVNVCVGVLRRRIVCLKERISFLPLLPTLLPVAPV